jgi:CRP-like cAMP-binding protein
MMMNPARDATQNHLLAALSDEDFSRWSPDLEWISLLRGTMLRASGAEMKHVYFPTSSIIALYYDLNDGTSVEIAAVGNEGVVGVSLFMGGGSLSRAMVQSSGQCLRMKARAIQDEFQHSIAIRLMLLRYTQSLITQVTQTAVCNRRHTIDQQLCRWLLATLDRLPNNDIVITHELLSGMLGVRREGVSESAGKLQRDGLIDCGRGHISVRDRAGLEARACECYGTVRKESTRLGAVPAHMTTPRLGAVFQPFLA